MSHTVVLQSHRPERLVGWLGRCSKSVQDWAHRQGFAYHFLNDALFEDVPASINERFADQPVVRSDLARLLAMARLLREGAERVIWCDADLFVFRDFAPSDRGDEFGRECWVQRDDRKLRSYRKIHNAWMQFHRASPVLPFYIDRATALLERATAPVVPQFIGPKLLTAWHNIAPFCVEERVGMLSPVVMEELLRGEKKGPAIARLRAGHGETLCALNLSASCEGAEQDGVRHDSQAYEALIDGLENGSLSAFL